MEERFKLFTVFMTKIRRSIQRIKTEEMAEYNLKSPHVSCLYYLYTYGNMTATELCEICDEDKAAISRTIAELEATGYVEAEDTDGKREYRTKLHLTKKGEGVTCILDTKIRNAVDLGGNGLTEEQRQTFYAVLDIISANLEKFTKEKNNENN